MTIQTSTLRPGLLVTLKTSIKGRNVSYDRRVIDGLYTDDEGAQKARWETERTVVDPVEHEAARLARQTARNTITGVCAASNFGLLCPEIAEDELEEAIAKARAIVTAFNASAKLCKLSLYVLPGRIAPNDIEAVKAINSEINELLSDMERGVGDGDVKTIRESANRAKGLAEMLSKEARAQAEIAIDAARRAAREIVKAEKNGQAVTVDKRAVRTIAEMRSAFVDLDDEAVPVAAPQASGGRQLDLDDEETEDERIDRENAEYALNREQQMMDSED